MGASLLHPSGSITSILGCPDFAGVWPGRDPLSKQKSAQCLVQEVTLALPSMLGICSASPAPCSSSAFLLRPRLCQQEEKKNLIPQSLLGGGRASRLSSELYLSLLSVSCHSPSCSAPSPLLSIFALSLAHFRKEPLQSHLPASFLVAPEVHTGREHAEPSTQPQPPVASFCLLSWVRADPASSSRWLWED